MRRHQLNAVWRWITSGNTYLAHDMGTGKTFTKIAMAMEARRLGLRKRPMIAVKNATLKQYERDVKKLYPTARVLVLHVRKNAEHNRQQLLRAQSQDWDMIIVPHSQFDMLGMSPERVRVMIKEEIQELEDYLQTEHGRISMQNKDFNDARQKQQRAMASQLRKAEDALKLKSQEIAAGTYKGISFEDLGVDMLLVDEAHAYKNIPFRTIYDSRNMNVKGVSGTGGNTAQEFFWKTKWMNQRHPGGLVLASGTPITNSIAEMFNLQRIMQPDVLKATGTHTFDAWAAAYGVLVTEQELSPTGQDYETAVRFGKFVNAGTLLRQVYQFFDAVTSEQAGVYRPQLATGAPITVDVPKSEYANEVYALILRRLAAIQADPKGATYGLKPDGRPNPDILLRLVNDGQLAAIDPRFVIPTIPEQEDSKITALVNNIFDHYKNPPSEIYRRSWREATPFKGPTGKKLVQITKEKGFSAGEYARERRLGARPREIAGLEKSVYDEGKYNGTQLVFVNKGAPKSQIMGLNITDDEANALPPLLKAAYQKMKKAEKREQFIYYNSIKAKLIKMGIPAKEIAFIHDADSGSQEKKSEKLQALQRAVNNGKTRVLIGSTHKAGVGMNFQKRVVAMHHLDVWWNYSNFAQASARGWRYGNINPFVRNYVYVTPGTVDAFVWQSVAKKSKVFDAIMSGSLDIEEFEDVSGETMTAIDIMSTATGNPLQKERADLLKEQAELAREERAHADSKRRAQIAIGTFADRTDGLKANIKNSEERLETLGKITAVKLTGEKQQESTTLILKTHGGEIAKLLEKIDQEVRKGTMLQGQKIPIGQVGVGEKVEGEKGKYAIAEVIGSLYLIKTMTLNEQVSLGVKIADGTSFERSFSTQGAITGYDMTGNLSRTITWNMEMLADLISKYDRQLKSEQAKHDEYEKIANSEYAKARRLRDVQQRIVTIDAELQGTGTAAPPLGEPKEGALFTYYSPRQEFADDAARFPGWESGYGGYWISGGLAVFENPIETRRNRMKRKLPVRSGSRVRGIYDIARNMSDRSLPTGTAGFISPVAFWDTGAGTLVFFDSTTAIRDFEYNMINQVFAAEMEPGDTMVYRKSQGGDAVEFYVRQVRGEHNSVVYRKAGAVKLADVSDVPSNVVGISRQVKEGKTIEQIRDEVMQSVVNAPAFKAPTGWDAITGTDMYQRPVTYKTGPDSTVVSDLKLSLAADKRFAGNPEAQVRIQAIQEVAPPADMDAVLGEQIRKIMGPEAKVVYVDSAGLFREVQHDVMGVGPVVYVDIRAPQALASLVAHGLWHADKSRYKQTLIDVLHQTIDLKRFQDMAAEFRATPAYANMTDDQIFEEFGARFLEGQIMQESFWKALASRSRVVYLRMAKWVIDTLNKLGIKVGGKPAVWSEYFSSPEKMATAVRAAQDYFLNKLGDLGLRPEAAIAAPLFSAAVPAIENPLVPPGVTASASAEEVTRGIRRDPTWSKIFINVTDKDLTSFVRLSSLPWWIAKSDKQGRAVMNVQLRRDDTRNETFVALTRSQAGSHLSEAAGEELDLLIANKGGLEKTTAEDIIAGARKPGSKLHQFLTWKDPAETLKRAGALLRRGQMHEFLTLDFKEAEALGRVIVESDAEVEYGPDGEIVRAGRIFSNDELKERGFNKNQITAYYAWKNGMDAAWETKLVYAQASIFWQYLNKPWMRMEVRTSGPQAARLLEISDLEKVADGLMTPAEAHARIREDVYDRGYDKDKAIKQFDAALKRAEAPLQGIRKYREQWGKVKFYMPRFRDQGPIVIRVPGTSEGAKDLYYQRFNPIAGTSISREAKVAYDKAVEQYGFDNVEFYRSPVIPENIYGDISEAALEKFIGRSIGRLQQEGEVDEKEAAALTESLFQELANDLNIRGFGQRSMPRAAGVPTKGYKEDHFQEMYRDYMSGMAGFLSKRKAAMEFHQALASMRPKKDKEGQPTGPQQWNSFDYWRRYAEDMLRNQDRGDELSAKVRSLAFIYFISGNLKGAIVNLTQSFVSTIPVGATITKGAEGKVLKAMRDIAFGRLTPREKRALQDAHDRGETTAQYIEDVMDAANSGGKDAIMKKVGTALSLPFRKAEVFNRKAAFLFSFRVYEAQGKQRKETMDLARDFVNDTQYMFGKANLPEWARSGTGVGKVLRTSYTFRSYSHNYLNAMAHYLSKDPESGKDSREFMVLARSLAFLAVLGGAGAGLPFLDDLLDILERMTGIQWRAQARRYMAETFGPVAEKFWTAGLPGMFGFDISGSLKLGLPSGASPDDTLYGVYGGMIDKGTQAIQMASTKQYARAGETLLPSFASNPLRAYREITEGAKTATGSTKFDEAGKPLKLGIGEAAGRAVGFRPVRDTLSSQEKREFDNLRSYYQNQRDKIRGAYRASEVSERAEIRKEAQAYNRSILKFRGAIPKIEIMELNDLLRPKPQKAYKIYDRVMGQ